jgi:hypothetical protein
LYSCNAPFLCCAYSQWCHTPFFRVTLASADLLQNFMLSADGILQPLMARLTVTVL